MRRNIKKLLLLKYLFYSGTLYSASSVFIVVHGTWGANTNWYMPGGEFFDTLEHTVYKKNSAVVPFCWSGGCGHASRLRAAHNLVKLIKAYDKSIAVYLVAHSHGGNVCMLASQLLGEDFHNKHRIRAVYTLGTPVMSRYSPNMDVIQYLYNLFSFEDCIQTVLGISAREYGAHARIANIRVFVGGKEPGHTDLHDPVVAQNIPMLHRRFRQYLREKNVCNTIAEPSIIYCDATQAPLYSFDAQRKELIERDRQLSVLVLSSFRKSLDTGSNIPLTNL